MLYDTNVFASARDLKSLEHLMNSGLAKVKENGEILTIVNQYGQNKLHDN